MSDEQPRPSDCLRELDAICTTMGIPTSIRSIIIDLARVHAGPEFANERRSPRRPKSLGDVAAVFHQLSLGRANILGEDMISDPAWNMLLALYTDSERGQVSSVSSLCHASGSPATTALRYVDRLADRGMIKRKPDWNDRRRVFVEIAEPARAMMARTIRSFCVEPPPGS